MAIKNFKAHKSYKKWAKPSRVEVLPKDGKRQMQFDKKKLPSLITYASSMTTFATLGFILGNLPGVLVGAIAGQQIAKYGMTLFQKLKKR